MSHKVLVFSTNSYIWSASFPVALIAESLRKEGMQIVYVTCNGCLNSYCTSFASLGLAHDTSIQEKNKICNSCNRKRNVISKNFQFPSINLDKFIDEDDKINIEKILSSINEKNFLELCIEGIELGRIALFEVLLKYKKITLEFKPHEWQHYLLYLRSVLITFFAANKIFKIEKPDVVLMYNNLYATNSVASKLAQKYCITQYSVSSGSSFANQYGSISLSGGNYWDFIKELINKWEDYKNIPCRNEELSYVTNHFIELFKGKNIFIYSSKKSSKKFVIKEHFNIKSDQKVLVATTSSYDEFFSAEMIGVYSNNEKQIFLKQTDWLKALIEWVGKNKNIFLIIRPHPREFPNRRDSFASEHSILLKNLLSNLPDNIQVDWPENKVSVYDLCLDADVFLNSGSTVGKEMSLLGIPVVVYSSGLLWYPEDLNYLGSTVEDYFEKINQALEEGWSFERVRRTYRWYVLEFYRSHILINESFNPQVSNEFSQNFFSRAFRKLKRTLFPDLEFVKDCKKRKEFLNSKDILNDVILHDHPNFLVSNEKFIPSVSQSEEDIFLKDQLKILSKFLSNNDSEFFKNTKLGSKLSALCTDL